MVHAHWVSLSFIIPGHIYMYTDTIGGLTDLAAVVNTSANVNITQLTGTPEGTVRYWQRRHLKLAQGLEMAAKNAKMLLWREQL